MSFTPSDAGKGDQSRVTNHRAYRASRLWWRSDCCNAKLNPDETSQPIGKVWRCSSCGGRVYEDEIDTTGQP